MSVGGGAHPATGWRAKQRADVGAFAFGTVGTAGVGGRGGP